MRLLIFAPILFAGVVSFADSDVVCTFPKANVAITIKDFHGTGWVGNIQPNYKLTWKNDNDKNPENLQSLGMPTGGSGPGIKGVDDNTSFVTMTLDFLRKDKHNRIAVFVCDKTSKDYYPAKLAVGKLIDPKNITNMEGDIFDGQCEKPPMDATNIPRCTKQ